MCLLPALFRCPLVVNNLGPSVPRFPHPVRRPQQETDGNSDNSQCCSQEGSQGNLRKGGGDQQARRQEGSQGEGPLQESWWNLSPQNQLPHHFTHKSQQVQCPPAQSLHHARLESWPRVRTAQPPLIMTSQLIRHVQGHVGPAAVLSSAP